MADTTNDSEAPQAVEQTTRRAESINADVNVETAQNGGSEETNHLPAEADSSAIDNSNASISPAPDGESPVPPQAQENAEEAENAATANSADLDEGTVAADAESAPDTGKKSRRRSGVPEHRAKKLNRKASNLTKQLHLDAKPGDYFMVKLKGYPTWPAIICDESMLPQALLASRPQTAARGDGSYREEYADGGKRVKERTFPVMFMATNEFAWTPNTDLRDFDLEVSRNFPPNRTKNLNTAHKLATEQHPLIHWKKVLAEFQESVHQAEEEELARKLAKEEKDQKKAAAKTSAKTVEESDIADPDDDATMDPAPDAAGETKKKKSTKKRDMADGESKDTPPAKKIKLTLKPSNGTPASSAKPKSEKKDTAAKSKKATAAKKAAAVPAKPAEPELTPEELHKKKEREILFLRHKLQKGLLNRDGPPEESQMATMAEYINKLEGYPDLEVSIIKTTKINKVLKAILKLDAIPRETDFDFKFRSTQLLAKWNHILENAPKEPSLPASTSAAANGVTNGDAKLDKPSPDLKDEEAKVTNGVMKEDNPETPKTEDRDGEAKKVEASVDSVMEDAAKSEADVAAPKDTEDTVLPDAADAVEATA